MTFADFILSDGNDSLIISDGTLNIKDLSQCIADILDSYYIFSHTEPSETLKEYYANDVEYMDYALLLELYEAMVSELEDILYNEVMYLTTAEGDPACLMICRESSSSDDCEE